MSCYRRLDMDEAGYVKQPEERPQVETPLPAESHPVEQEQPQVTQSSAVSAQNETEDWRGKEPQQTDIESVEKQEPADDKSAQEGFISLDGTRVSDSYWKGEITPRVHEFSNQTIEQQSIQGELTATGQAEKRADLQQDKMISPDKELSQGVQSTQGPEAEGKLEISQPENKDVIFDSGDRNTAESRVAGDNAPRGKDVVATQDNSVETPSDSRVGLAADKQFEGPMPTSEQDSSLADALQRFLNQDEAESPTDREEQGLSLLDALQRFIDREERHSPEASDAQALADALQRNKGEKDKGQRKLFRKELQKGQRLQEAMLQRKESKKLLIDKKDSGQEPQKRMEDRTLRWEWEAHERGSQSSSEPSSPVEMNQLGDSLAEEQESKQTSKTNADRQDERFTKDQVGQQSERKEGHYSALDQVWMPANFWRGAAQQEPLAGPETQSDQDRAAQRRAEKTRGGDAVDKNGPMSDKEFEKFQRNRFVSPVDGIGFQFNKAKAARGETNRFIKSLPEDKRQALNDHNTQVFLYVSGSRPGTAEYNQRLTEQRGEELKRELIEKHGVKAKITIVPLGERAARTDDQSPMSLKEPSDRDPQDRIDDPWDRTAKIVIQPQSDSTKDKPILSLDRARQLPQDIRAGEEIAKEFEKLGEQVRKEFPLPENPFGDVPSRDPGEFGKQILDKAKEPIKDTIKGVLKKDGLAVPKAVGKAVGKIFLGSEYEGLVRTQQREVVEKQRNRYYGVLSAGAASGLDSSYIDKYHHPRNDLEQKLFDTAKQFVKNLSPLAKHQLHVYLTERDIAESYRLPMDKNELAEWKANENAQWWKAMNESADGYAFFRETRRLFNRRHFSSD
jgi:outer membrane protein OmpA-like peptidoglycan-associated protein